MYVFNIFFATVLQPERLVGHVQKIETRVHINSSNFLLFF